MSVAVFSSPRFTEHRTPDGHPERSARIEAVWRACAGLPRTDVVGPADDATLGLVHDPAHLRRVAAVCAAGGGPLDAGDTHASPASDAVARLGVAACVAAGEAVLDGAAARAFAAVRPPGHHALPGRAMGFCLYANAAVLARHLRRRGAGRVAVVDFDVHHGNGTQAAFLADPDVLTVSLHQDPRTLWPGSGFAGERGEGAGLGATLNVPLPPGTGDGAYLEAFGAALDAVRGFGPEFVIACAGFDAAAADPLANLELTIAGFAGIGRRLAAVADDCCGGRLVATLEGGYDLNALHDGVAAFLGELA